MNFDTSRCAAIGYGSWASTLVGQLIKKGVEVWWLVTNPDVREGILSTGRNPKYVSDLEFDLNRLHLTEDINEAVSACEIVLLGCPSAFLKNTLQGLTVSLKDKFIISAIKGIVPDDYTTVLEYMHDAYNLHFSSMGVISGPSHAEEVSRGKLSYLTAAGSDAENNLRLAGMFADENLRIDTSLDIYGIEYASILKNIYAIASGLATGLGYGDNFLAVLVSSCACEMELFLNESYPFKRNANSRAYLGDLLVTCYSNYSRNRRLGQLIGKGCTVKSAINEMTMIAEGYYSANCIHIVNLKHGISIPIADMVYSVLFEKASARKAMAELAKKL